MKLSVALITFNEERILAKTLSAVHEIADEIIIVDSGSTDATEKISRGFSKVKFVSQPFLGFGMQKNFAIDLCSNDWILFLDADEIPDAAALADIQNIIQKPDARFSVYTVEFRNIFLGKALKYGGWGNIRRERFFKKSAGRYSSDFVHEIFETKNSAGKLAGCIDHYTYQNIFHHIEKSNKYTSMMAEKMHQRGKKSGVLKIIFKPLYQFLKSYLIRAGFLDGLPGFYLAITASFYTFLKYIKLYEAGISKN